MKMNLKTLVLAALMSGVALGGAQAATVKHHHAKMSKGEIRAVQTALNGHGEHIRVDGRWGKMSKAALKDFQKTHHLKATGHLDKATKRALNV